MADVADESKSQPEKLPTSFSIWPPTQRTRDAVINRLIDTLTAPSILSNRYGTLPQNEAEETARRIEDHAFNTLSASASQDDDGIEILQAYSKEISKGMLDAVKARSTPPSQPESAPVDLSAPVSEDTSSIKSD
ncbi:MFP1 attachment factor 1-like [Impatiens glandulifera]|uniref:MFP1 attachment factor 1-like n=1 Tax=Impatiens glandulifera TaxID=253017 RepID=UPI001FB0D3FE|nr:MFP1 attachment factor 1-like [Impatiens glandulifera]